MYVHGARILGLFPLPRESNFVMFGNIMKALAENGHEVDVYSYFPQKNKIPRYLLKHFYFHFFLSIFIQRHNKRKHLLNSLD